MLRYIEIGRKEAGAPRCGGNRLTGGAYAKGYFVEPTVFADVTQEMTIAREEIFGPVLAVMRARDFEDAMRIANAGAVRALRLASRPPMFRASSSTSTGWRPACSP